MYTRPICFDLDGVIINSEPTHMESFKRTLASRNIALTDEDYAAYFAGKTDEQGFADFLTAKSISLHELPELLIDKTQTYLQLTTSIDYCSDATILIRDLTDHGTPMAVVTGSNKAETVAALEAASLSNVFSTIVCSEDILRGKPHPESYLLAAERLGVAAHDCIAIEDSPSGCKAAKAAGMTCIAVTNTHRAAELWDADRITDQLNARLLADL